jgi:hypothetical protein
MKSHPPRKMPGQGKGPHQINGEVMQDIRTTAIDLGITEKALRARVMRRLIPFRKWSGRICFLRSELEQFFSGLPGCPINEAIKNDQLRSGIE